MTTQIQYLLQPFVHTRKTAARFIAGDIKEGTFLLTGGAGRRRLQGN